MTGKVSCNVFGCLEPASVTSSTVLPITGGFMEHMRIDCAAGHWSFDLVPVSAETAARAAGW